MLVEVALPLPLPQTFTYRLESDAAPPGTRVLVPFGRRRLVGWITGREPDAAGVKRLRDVIRVLDEDLSAPGASSPTGGPVVPPELLRLCEWVAAYYLAPLGQVLRTALPAVLSDARRPAPPVLTRRVIRLGRELPSLRERDALFARAPRQRECYELLESTGGSAEVSHLTGNVGFSRSVLEGLVAKALATFADAELARDPFAEIDPGPPPRLEPTAAQRAAIDSFRGAAAAGADGEDRRPFLLRGVTGSGKTLVYIELLREVVERHGRGAIVLVPEIALTPQTVARFRAHFGDTVAVLHSGLSDGERYDAWRALRAGERRIAIGARSAVFAPVPDPGAIIVDEEHESTYKQSDAPRYHAREVAIVRANLAGAVCVLGSATPALESWANARSGKYRLVELPERVEGRPLPPVRVVDLRKRADDEDRAGPGAGILSPPLRDALAARLERREQSILLLNRRGYATFVQCRECGHVWHCGECNVSLTFHRARRRLVCHYCFHEETPPERCGECGSAAISFRGVGTEQVERSVGEAFPRARLARMDVDTTSGKWAHQTILDRVARGAVDILLGTQMIAKGLDFPRVTLVGVINADVGLNLPDFRAGERTFQLLTQVAGRAGRGELRGEVIVQTAMPEQYAIRRALEHDYPGFAEIELAERVTPCYPPHCRLLNVVVSGTDEDAVARGTEDAAAWVRAHLRARDRVQLLGPAPCAIDRVRGRWRWHFLLRSPSAAAIGRLGRAFHLGFPQRASAGDLRVALDRDPVALL